MHPNLPEHYHVISADEHATGRVMFSGSLTINGGQVFETIEGATAEFFIRTHVKGSPEELMMRARLSWMEGGMLAESCGICGGWKTLFIICTSACDLSDMK